jgi:hypothetical protein
MRGVASPSIETQAEFFPVETTNARWSVAYFTLSIEGTPDAARREAIDDSARREGGRAVWRANPSVGRSYVLLELPEGRDAQPIRAAPGETAYPTAIIAMALSPTVPQALPSLREALLGPGRPAGVLACRPCDDGIVLEWDPNVSSADVILGLVDVELRRFGGGRTIQLLSPLPPATIAKIAAAGLQAPQITPERVLELLIDDV